MRTLAELKRDAKNGTIKFELVERFGETGEQLPERCRGTRTPAKVNTVGIMLRTEDGQESELRFGCASLCEYDGETLKFYNPGTRELNDEEKAFFKQYHRELEQREKANPYGDSYWWSKSYFEKSDFPYLSGYDKIRGKKLEWEKAGENSNPKMIYHGLVPLIVDDSIKGETILIYKIHR